VEPQSGECDIVSGHSESQACWSDRFHPANPLLIRAPRKISKLLAIGPSPREKRCLVQYEVIASWEPAALGRRYTMARDFAAWNPHRGGQGCSAPAGRRIWKSHRQRFLRESRRPPLAVKIIPGASQAVL